MQLLARLFGNNCTLHTVRISTLLVHHAGALNCVQHIALSAPVECDAGALFGLVRASVRQTRQWTIAHSAAGELSLPAFVHVGQACNLLLVAVVAHDQSSGNKQQQELATMSVPTPVAVQCIVSMPAYATCRC